MTRTQWLGAFLLIGSGVWLALQLFDIHPECLLAVLTGCVGFALFSPGRQP